MESKTNTPEFRQNLKAIFEKFDSDKNGTLDHKEATAALKELGHETTDQALSAFFTQVDANHDGKISFEELYTWATSDGGKNVNPLKLQILRLAKQAGKQAKHLAKDLKDQQENISHHHIGTQAGKVIHAGTKVHACVHFGDEADTHFKDVSKGLDLTEPASIVFQFKSTNPEAAKAGLLEVFQGAKDFVAMAGMAPPDINLDDITFTASTDGEYVRIGVQLKNNMEFEALVGQFEFMAQSLIGAVSGSVAVDLSLATSIGSIVEDSSSGKNTSFIEQVTEGLSFSLDARVPDGLVEIFRSQFLEQGPNSLPRELRPLVPLLFLRSSKIQFDFNSQIRKAIPPGIDQLGLEAVLPQLKMLPIDQIGLMAPPLGQFIDVAKEHLQSDLKLYVCGPKVVASVHLRSDGLGKLWDLLSA